MSHEDYDNPYFECVVCGHLFHEDDASPIDFCSTTCRGCGEVVDEPKQRSMADFDRFVTEQTALQAARINPETGEEWGELE